jgi:hypothetical protein
MHFNGRLTTINDKVVIARYTTTIGSTIQPPSSGTDPHESIGATRRRIKGPHIGSSNLPAVALHVGETPMHLDGRPADCGCR